MMMYSACFRRANHSSHSLTPAVRACQRRAALGCGKPTREPLTACRTCSTAAAGETTHRRSPSAKIASDDHSLWTSSSVTNHLGAAEYRCLSHNSGCERQQPAAVAATASMETPQTAASSGEAINSSARLDHGD